MRASAGPKVLCSWGAHALAGALVVSLFAASPARTGQVDLTLELVTSSLDRPVFVTHAGDGTDRLFIAEQPGRIRVMKGGVLLPQPFLNIETLVSCCGERGLLGLAFHPDYAENGFFFVDYTDLNGDTIISRYKVSADPNVADPRSAARLLFIDQPYANHNGGHLAFGPDGYLYIATGDGGGAGDPLNSGQRLNTLLGKILRIDVNAESGYLIPPTNPFLNDAGLDEIWAYGLRNPWRFSFDRETGDLYIADVGQNLWEEVNFQPAGSPGGMNYGWRVMEGFHCYNPSTGCNQAGLTLPVYEYSHQVGCSVTGGYVYRGMQVPELAGTYIFGDYCRGTIWGLRQTITGGWSHSALLETDLRFRLSSFGEDESGEVYVADLSRAVYRIIRSGGGQESSSMKE